LPGPSWLYVIID
jgi:hypothetical protein